MTELPDRVRFEIESVRRDRSKSLNLANKQLEVVPWEIYGLRQLEELFLWSNAIRIIPEWIREFPNLKLLDIRENPIEQIIDIPGLLLDWDAYLRCRHHFSPENIRGLNISLGAEPRNPVDIPEASRLRSEVFGLQELQSLRIGFRSITVDEARDTVRTHPEIKGLIDGVGQLDQLEEFILWGILLYEVPNGVRNLKKLKKLVLGDVRARELPNWLVELSALQQISIVWNLFGNFPSVVFRIPTLQILEFSASPFQEPQSGIKEIPAEILELQNLKELDVNGQPVETPPPEVVKEGVEAIKNYWRQQQEAGVDYLCEAKVLIVGEGGAGKTSLAKKIDDPDYKLKADESSTEGIEITRWDFPTALRVKKNGGEKLIEREFGANLWDFGGQEIYHTTHQFFLTRRSLYLLVADDRKEDTDFNYWLQVAELFGDQSPLLIVQNEKQDRQRDINFPSLRARFSNLKETYRVNLATNRGLDTLIEAIRQELEHLPHIGTPLPKTWTQVRDALEQDTRNYIGLEEFLAICETQGFKRREDKLQLSGYLHDLGICLHFQDDPILKKTVILKPKWGTDAVYRVLDDRTVIDNGGRFNRDDLARIWSEDAYAPMRDELLALMNKFRLCYELPERGAYIAPQLLSSTQPSYPWNDRGNLILSYGYEFMPKGIITRFIVALHHLIEDQTLVWKTGVILKRQGTRAEVIEDYPHRRIVVRIDGADTRGLLAIIDDHLDQIHHTFPRLKYETYLPCNCQVCRERTDPFPFKLSELRDFAQTGDTIQCRISRKLVDAGALVRDVMPSALATVRGEPGEAIFREPEVVEPDPRKEVFVSYNWNDESKAIVDQLEQAFADQDIAFVRDRNELKYKDGIREFMKRIGRGKCIVVVLSKKYLESKSCMFELTEIADNGEIQPRVFPIVLDDANIYEAMGRLDYILHWEQKKEELDKKMKKAGGEYLRAISEELNLYEKTRNTIDGLLDILGNMNALTPEQHKAGGFDELLRALQNRLAE